MKIACLVTSIQFIQFEQAQYQFLFIFFQSQRAVKMRLEIIEKQEKKKRDKILEEKLKQQKHEEKVKEKQKKIRQRQEIYALNKKMTEFENKNFVEFCKTRGIDPKL